MISEITRKMSEFQERDSRWALKEILYLAVNINQYNPLRASGFIELPNIPNIRRNVINIKSNDRLCFIWCILACLTKIYSENVKNYPQN